MLMQLVVVCYTKEMQKMNIPIRIAHQDGLGTMDNFLICELEDAVPVQNGV
jgi:hypothetical protein